MTRSCSQVTPEERNKTIIEALRKLKVSRWSEIKREIALKDATLARGLKNLIKQGKVLQKGGFYALKEYEGQLDSKVGIWGGNLNLAIKVLSREKEKRIIRMALQILDMLEVESRLKVKVIKQRLGLGRYNPIFGNALNELKKRKIIGIEKGEIYLLPGLETTK